MLITQHNEIPEIFADHYAKILRDLHMESNKEIHKEGKIEGELKAAIKKTEKHSTRGRHHKSSDDKKLTPDTLKFLLDLCNKILEEEG